MAAPCRCRQQAGPSTSFVDNAINLFWRNFLSAEFEATHNAKTTLVLNVAECSYNIVMDMWKNASMPRTVSIDCLLVTIQYQVVTDGDKGYGVSIALRCKNDSSLVLVNTFAVIFELPQTEITCIEIFR